MKRRTHRRDRRIRERRHDVYKVRGKLKDGTQCSKCGANYSKGRWTWDTPKEVKKEIICPACQRIQDGYPAGFIEIKGEFYSTRRDEFINLIRNIEKQQSQNHPMQRIIRINEKSSTFLEVETTGTHLARGIGEALSRAYQGEYSFHYADGYNRIRVYWERTE